MHHIVNAVLLAKLIHGASTAQWQTIVVDDDPAVRHSLSRLIRQAGLNVETFASADEFLSTFRSDGPACLVLDVRMPGMDGFELRSKLLERNAHIPTIIITGHADVPMAVRAMRSGVVDFVEKPFRGPQLLERIHQAIDLDRRQRKHAEDNSEQASRFAALTPREREILTHVVAGQSNKMIAADLGISQRTVEVHRARVMQKMGVDSLAELVRFTDRVSPEHRDN